jgi:hypothetical protein
VLAAACNGTLVPATTGSLASSALTETSGIAASHRADDVYWVHNDSGDTARVFAVGGDGRDLAEFGFSGATNVDWEDIAVGPGPSAGVSYLYAADIGDNARARSFVAVYRVPEPLVDPSVAAGLQPPLTGVDELMFTYPDGPHDAEAALVDPVNGEILVVTKDLAGGNARVYRAPANLPAGSTTTLVLAASLNLGPGQGVTGADVTPAGDAVALRTYFSVFLFPRPAGLGLGFAFWQPWCLGAAPPQGSSSADSEPQGEAIAFTRAGTGYLTVSEGVHANVHRFLVP